MIEVAEKVGESSATNTEQHPLEQMPSFEDHMFQMETGELGEMASEVSSASDQTIERIFDKLGRDAGEGYFEDPDKLVLLVQDAISQTPQQAIDNFRAQVENYEAKSNDKYRAKAAAFYDRTRNNVQRLVRENLVGSDTIKVFLNPDYISSVGRGRMLSEYNAIQSDFARRDEESWADGTLTYQRYQMRAKELADSFAEDGGDVAYQKEISGVDTAYDPNKPIIPGDFIHVNSNQPRGEGGLRCYISPDKTTDPSAVLYAWKESVQDSPLKDSLYFKFSTSIAHKDGRKQRPDDIVIYKTDNIDDGQFKELLQDFQNRCNEMSPDLLPSDESKMPAAAQKIANGISIAGEPDYVNDYLRYTDHKEGKHSWTTFIDKMTLLSTSVAANRLGVKPDSIEVPGLEDETKKVFREFMLLSQINPDTMLPAEYGDEMPDWAMLNNDIESDIAEVAEGQSAKADLAEKAAETDFVEQDQPSDITSRRQVTAGEKSALYSVEKTDGKVSTQVESDYFDTASEFNEAHEELRNDADLRQAISGLSMDLALIDATNGRNFENGDEKQRAVLLEDYSTLRARLDNPEASESEKMLIAEYFDRMGGAALSFLENHYVPDLAQSDDLEQGRSEKEFRALLDEAKQNLEKAKMDFLEDNEALGSTLSQIDEVMGGRAVDTDQLQSQLNGLTRINDDLTQTTLKFVMQNTEYESILAKGQAYLGDEEYAASLSEISENEVAALTTSKKLNDVSGRIDQIKHYLSVADGISAGF